ncbi:MAG: sulfatase, partial [Bacteroidetes bacterium]
EFVASIWPGGVQPETAAPVMVRDGEEVSLSCSTEGASLGYQLLAPGDSLAPAWSVYTGPFAAPAGRQVVAVAHRLGFVPSTPVYEEQGSGQ